MNSRRVDSWWEFSRRQPAVHLEKFVLRFWTAMATILTWMASLLAILGFQPFRPLCTVIQHFLKGTLFGFLLNHPLFFLCLSAPFFHGSFQLSFRVGTLMPAFLFHLISRWRSWTSLDSMHGLYNFLGTTKPFSSRRGPFEFILEYSESEELLPVLIFLTPLILNWASFNSWTTLLPPSKVRIMVR